MGTPLENSSLLHEMDVEERLLMSAIGQGFRDGIQQIDQQRHTHWGAIEETIVGAGKRGEVSCDEQN
ncbi:MAG: hypothetical protein SGI88_17590 [Candidatus Hydrogenedentes bacterium]|nr:hypothetical protein [Candidatus Hydrogenedentota bacterium]